MKAAFAEVLAEETTILAAVADMAALDRWRQHLVDRATSTDSAYAKALRPASDPEDRAIFLEQWRDLIETALARVVNAETPEDLDIDVHQTAVSVLAALYGGTVLSRLAKDAGPLQVSVALALAPLLPITDSTPAQAEKRGPSVP